MQIDSGLISIQILFLNNESGNGGSKSLPNYISSFGFDLYCTAGISHRGVWTQWTVQRQAAI